MKDHADEWINNITLGNVLAGIISWNLNHSLLRLIIHSVLSWFYIFYAVVSGAIKS